MNVNELSGKPTRTDACNQRTAIHVESLSTKRESVYSLADLSRQVGIEHRYPLFCLGTSTTFLSPSCSHGRVECVPRMTALAAPFRCTAELREAGRASRL